MALASPFCHPVTLCKLTKILSTNEKFHCQLAFAMSHFTNSSKNYITNQSRSSVPDSKYTSNSQELKVLSPICI